MSEMTRQPCDEGVILGQTYSPPTEEAGHERTKFWVLVATILGSSMVFINGSTVNVALPALQLSLGATVVDIQWIINSYTLLLAALILLGGTLGDRYGRRQVFLIGVVIFTLASVWCGVVSTPTGLMIARAAQGIGGALLTPGSLAILSATFDDQDRGRAIGLWSGFSALTSAVGPLLGGWLIDNFSWRWIFFIHVPFAIVVIAVSVWRMPESHDEETTGSLDWWGAVVATAGLGALMYGLIESSNRGLGDSVVIIAIVVGVILLGLFVWLESRLEAPMVPLNLFRSSTFSGANLLTLLLYTALGGALFFLPLNLIQVQGYTATESGAAFLPFILLMSMLSSWAGGLVDRMGARLPLTIGPMVTAVGYLLFAWPSVGGSYWLTFFPALLVLGFGMAISVAPLTTAVMGSVPTHYAGTASGVNNAVSRVASLLAIALLGIVMLSVFGRQLTVGLAAVDGLPTAAGEEIMARQNELAAIQVPDGLTTQQADQAQMAIHQAFVAGFRIVAYIAAGLSVASGMVAWFTIEDHGAKREEAEDGAGL